MFSHIVSSVNLDFESSTNFSDTISELLKITDQTRLEYEESKATLHETNKEIILKKEQLSIIESERVKLMSKLAQEIQTHQHGKRRMEDLKNTLQSIEFDLNKYNKIKIRTDDLETLAGVKKKFNIYKHLLKIHFDCSNRGVNALKQKGYMFNIITKKLKYFEFNMDGKDIEISEYLWNKMMLVSDENWELLLL